MQRPSPALKTAVKFFSARGVLRRQLTAALFISLLCSPATFGISTSKVLPIVQAPPMVPVPVTAPPEPFVIEGTSSLTVLTVFAASTLTAAASAIDSIAFPSRLEGLKAASTTPTVGERMFASVIPVLGFLKPSASSVVTTAPPQPSSVVDFDFDNDGKADIGRWHPANTEFKVRNSNGGSFSTFSIGSSSAVVAPGDFNGDGKTDAAVFSGGTWTYKTSTGATAQTISWGTSGDVPVAGDYDGDGITDAAIYRPSTNTWWILKSTGGNTSTALGSAGDITVPGDYDGDGKSDLAVYRPSTGYWYVNGTSVGSYGFNWGISIDTPVPADYDGDGKTDHAVFRPSTGTWYVHRSSDAATAQQAWGNYRDQPVPADYDGDGKADFAIWRPTTGTWYILKSSDSSYDIHPLGVPTDTAIPSAYLKQVGGQVSGDALAAARLSPRNATGGTNLYSQNFSWGRTLVDLPGRAGFDAGFGISYNSLVWTKVGNAMVFDPDYSQAGPGFRFGFPTIEPIYYDTDDGKNVWAYMMVTASGSRVQFRQTAVSNTYETADSGYTQLVTAGATSPNDPVEDVTITVTTTDGTQMKYVWSMGAYRCTEIKDRNGNYISIVNDSEGRLSTMTDTLGRVVTVNYESTTGLPSTLTQTWRGNNGAGSEITHTWATLTYKTEVVDTDFHTSLTVVGPPDGTSVSVLDKITYPDGSSTKFDYNGYLQVRKVTNVAGDSPTHVLNSVETNLASPGTGLSDCPRFTETSTFAQNFNSGNPLVVTNDAPVSSSFTGPNGSESTMVVKAKVTGHPDNLYARLHYGGSGYKEGLTLATEDCTGTDSACSTRKRWTWADWTQDKKPDNTFASYIMNPRVTETRIGDSINAKVTNIDYRIVTGTANTAEYGLVSEVRVYDENDLNNPIKKVATDYNLASAHTSRRIIGLPSQVEAWGKNDVTGSLEYVSKVTYGYDEENFSYESNQIVAPTRHDSTNYGSTFVSGRGNMTSTSRHDVTSATAASVSKVRYDVAGSPVAQLDPRGRKTTISYADSFNSTVGAATYAYPTTLTDAGGYSSTIEYRYDIGANVHAESPTPYGASDGKNTTRIYDDVIGRLVKEKIDNTGAYTRYHYPNNDGVTVHTYTTVADVTGVGTIDSSDEVLTETLLDGAGRVRMTRTENPNSTGGYTGKLVEHDLLGRLKRETVPTEIDSSWTPAGDDDRGSGVWLWNSREYDWKDRVTREINTDGTDKLYSYEGCGCAGGQVTTIKGEVTEARDMGDQVQTTKRRTQKVYEDILGRSYKSELWDLDGAGSAPYSTTVNAYNGRDQVLRVRQYSGSDTSTTYQDTTFEFDGHGRSKKSHKPEQFDSNNTATYTVFTYNADDTVASVTDPRGAVTAYEYGSKDDSSSSEHRALPTKILYTSPNTTSIPEPGDVSFAYDPAGNRTSMSDDSGTLSYSYDPLSRLESETKLFTGTLANARSGGYALQYTYHLTGGIKSITDPHTGQGWHVEYASDKVGRTTAVGNATGFGSQTSFASGIGYRAFGGVKAMTYSTTTATSVSVSYDNRLRPLTYEAASSANTVDIQNKTYSYTYDGSVKQATNAVDGDYSQEYEYDFAGRLKKNNVGGLGTGTPGTRYKQTLGYDAFSNLTSRATWDEATYRAFTAAYTNNRKTSGGYQNGTDAFDAAGNVVANTVSTLDQRAWKFDAVGRVADWVETSAYGGTTRWDQGETLTFDGDGRTTKRLKRSRMYASPPSGWYEEPEYYVYSSVTRQKMIELDQTGQWRKTNVYMGSTVIAEHSSGGTAFKHTDPVTGSVMQTNPAGEIEAYDVGRVELEALGAVLPTQPPEIQEPPHSFGKGGSTSNPETGCQINSSPVSCRRMMDTLKAWGALFAGSQLVQETWREEHKVTVYGHIPEEANLRAVLRERGIYGGSTWVLVRSEMISLPGGFQNEGEVAKEESSGSRNNSSQQVPSECEKAIKVLGEDVWQRVQELLKNPPLFDIESLPGIGFGPARSFRGGNFELTSPVAADDPGRLYFGNYADAGETVGDAFDRNQSHGGTGAWVVRGIGITDGIYYRGSRTSFANNLNFLLHEVVHLAFPTPFDLQNRSNVDLDDELSLALTIKRDSGQSASDAVSRFFNSGCDPRYWSPPQESK